MKNSLILLCFCLSNFAIAQTVDDNIKSIVGQWTGTLTYTDYSDDVSKSTLNCFMKVNWNRKKGNISIGFEEPNGKIYYDKSKIKVLKNGNKIKFDGAIYSVDIFTIDHKSKYWTLVMTANGKDNNQHASIRQTIIFSGKELSISKEVKYKTSEYYFLRNKYSFKRKE